MGYKKDMSKYENLEGWERCGFGEQLDRWAEKYGERIAVTDSEDEISYMELKQKADCLAAAFLRKGILKGDKVLVQLPNRISFVIVFFALSKIGAVPIMMLPAHREAELEGIIELAKPAAYIVVEKYLGFSYVPMANAMKEKYSCIRHIFVDSESGDISGMIAETYGENGAFPAVDGYETAVLLLSGGTTGVPKLIPRTHTDYMYNARMSAKRCRLDSSDVYLASLPVAHNFPLCARGF
ncbi:MAG: AMP-binding protein [Coprococcus sp.]